MWIKKGNIKIILLINIVIICLSFFLFFSLLHEKLSVLTFQIIFTALIFLPLNTFLWFSKINVGFYRHWLSIYICFFCSTVIFYTIKALLVDKTNDFPPGEIYFDLFLTVFIYAFLQLIIFLLANGITFIINKFIQKNLT